MQVQRWGLSVDNAFTNPPCRIIFLQAKHYRTVPTQGKLLVWSIS